VALVAAILISGAVFVVWSWWIAYRSSREGGGVGMVSIGISGSWIGLPVLIVAVVVFLAGFYWKFRKLTTGDRHSH